MTSGAQTHHTTHHHGHQLMQFNAMFNVNHGGSINYRLNSCAHVSMTRMTLGDDSYLGSESRL